MMPEVAEHYVSSNTIVVLVLFLIVYEYSLLKRVSRSSLGLFDFCILSSIAVLPVFFAFFPSIVLWVTHVIGIGFPFLLLFGGLFLVVFIFMFRVILRLNKLEKKLTQFAQEEAIKHEQVLNAFNAKSRISE